MQIVLFYDGDCALCNKTVQFILKHEKENPAPVLFSSLQSEYARNALKNYDYNFNELSTLVLTENNTVYYKSEAALRLCRYLKSPYNWLLAFKICPRFIRDAAYDYIARNRKKLYKKTFCYLPSPAQKQRFLS